MVDCNGLENRRTEGYRGFESLSLRHPIFIKSLIHNGLATFIMPVSPRILIFWGRCGDAKHCSSIVDCTFSLSFS